MKIKEVIVVEGKNDTNVLQSYLDCDTIETHGTHIGEGTLCLIKQAMKSRGVIIFTDPDHPGEHIRNVINQRIPGCKNVYIEKNKAKTSKKVGVEHANKDDIIEALAHQFTYDEGTVETLSWSDFLAMGFNGRVDSAMKRERLASILYLGKPNAKTLYKRLNMLRLSKEGVEEILAALEK